MNIRKYPQNITTLSLSEYNMQFQFSVNPDLFWFEGHFDDFPILAGVAQIDWVMMLVKQYFPNSGHFSGIQQVKYQQPIFPKEVITLTIELNSEKSILTFEYENDRETKSSGKIKLQI